MENLGAPLTWNARMLVSGIILTVTFVGIFTEAVHGFHRTKFAMGGAGLKILTGQYTASMTPSWRSKRSTATWYFFSGA